MGPCRLPPEKAHAELWEEIRQHPYRYLIPAGILVGLLGFSLVDIGLRAGWFSK